MRQNLIILVQSQLMQTLIARLGKDNEVDKVICDFVHQFWIENPRLIKLVHFQGYDVKLLSITVSKIESLICMWDWLPEMMGVDLVK
jgi:hypothetical protein